MLRGGEGTGPGVQGIPGQRLSSWTKRSRRREHKPRDGGHGGWEARALLGVQVRALHTGVSPGVFLPDPVSAGGLLGSARGPPLSGGSMGH